MSESESNAQDSVPQQPKQEEMGTPANIHKQESGVKFEDISLPDNSGNKSVIEVYYKRYFLLFVGIVGVIFGSLFGLGILSFQSNPMTILGSLILLIPVFLLFWLFERRANS